MEICGIQHNFTRSTIQQKETMIDKTGKGGDINLVMVEVLSPKQSKVNHEVVTYQDNKTYTIGVVIDDKIGVLLPNTYKYNIYIPSSLNKLHQTVLNQSHRDNQPHTN